MRAARRSPSLCAETITVITNRVESFHRFATWFGFGAEEGVLATNDPIYQEKLIKFNQLVANCVMLQNVLDMSQALRQYFLNIVETQRKAA